MNGDDNGVKEIEDLSKEVTNLNTSLLVLIDIMKQNSQPKTVHPSIIVSISFIVGAGAMFFFLAL